MRQQGILLESGTNEMELLAVVIDDQVFGINVAKVKSIERYDSGQVTAFPEAPPGILGMFLYRGGAFPLIDLAAVVGKPQRSESDRDIVIVTEFNNTVTSFKVSGVKRIHRLSWSQLVPVNPMMGSQPVVTGSVNIEGVEILILDLEYILATLFPELVIAAVSDEVMNNRETVDRDQLRILFAEDSKVIRKTVAKLLEKAGFTDIEEFENGHAALDYINNNRRAITCSGHRWVLVSDIEMPVMDGLTLCNRVKSDTDLEAIFVVMFSSLINDQMITKCKRVGADRYVTKPESDDLVKILDGFLH